MRCLQLWKMAHANAKAEGLNDTTGILEGKGANGLRKRTPLLQ